MGNGGLAAATASVLTYPLDTIRYALKLFSISNNNLIFRRRMMVNGGVGFEN